MWKVEIQSEKRTVLSGKQANQIASEAMCGKPARWVIIDGDEKTYVCERCKMPALEAASENATIKSLDDEI